MPEIAVGARLPDATFFTMDAEGKVQRGPRRYEEKGTANVKGGMPPLDLTAAADDRHDGRRLCGQTRRPVCRAGCGQRAAAGARRHLNQPPAHSLPIPVCVGGPRLCCPAGPFTPGCTQRHLPGYVKNYDAIKAKRVDTVACVAVSDAFVMQAWKEANNAPAAMLFLGTAPTHVGASRRRARALTHAGGRNPRGPMRAAADPTAAFAKATGLVTDASAFGLGLRSVRYSMLVEDGVVRGKWVDYDGRVKASAAGDLLAKL